MNIVRKNARRASIVKSIYQDDRSEVAYWQVDPLMMACHEEDPLNAVLTQRSDQLRNALGVAASVRDQKCQAVIGK